VVRLLTEGGMVIAADISEKVLQKTMDLTKEWRLSDNLKTFQIDLSNPSEIEEKIGRLLL